MAPRIMSPGTTRWLEWGQDSYQPGSQVRDIFGNPVFTGSVVKLRALGGAAGTRGVVVALLDIALIEVDFEGFSGLLELPPAAVEVDEALPASAYPRALCNRSAS